MPKTTAMSGNVPLEKVSYYELELAAELGKTLLERNKHLESQVDRLEDLVEERTLECEYLQRQMDNVREHSELHLRHMDEMERQLTSAETLNKTLQSEGRSATTRKENYEKTIATLEAKVDELQETVNELRRHSHVLSRRSNSLPSGTVGLDEIKNLMESNGLSPQVLHALIDGGESDERLVTLERELDSQRKRCTELETEIDRLSTENMHLRMDLQQSERARTDLEYTMQRCTASTGDVERSLTQELDALMSPTTHCLKCADRRQSCLRPCESMLLSSEGGGDSHHGSSHLFVLNGMSIYGTRSFINKKIGESVDRSLKVPSTTSLHDVGYSTNSSNGETPLCEEMSQAQARLHASTEGLIPIERENSQRSSSSDDPGSEGEASESGPTTSTPQCFRPKPVYIQRRRSFGERNAHISDFARELQLSRELRKPGGDGPTPNSTMSRSYPRTPYEADQSLLSEIHEQYRTLIEKYERLKVAWEAHPPPQPKRQSTKKHTITTTYVLERQRSKTNTMSQQTSNFDLSTLATLENPGTKSKSTPNQASQPEYRKIFQEIFETLRSCTKANRNSSALSIETEDSISLKATDYCEDTVGI